MAPDLHATVFPAQGELMQFYGVTRNTSCAHCRTWAHPSYQLERCAPPHHTHTNKIIYFNCAKYIIKGNKFFTLLIISHNIPALFSDVEIAAAKTKQIIKPRENTTDFMLFQMSPKSD